MDFVNLYINSMKNKNKVNNTEEFIAAAKAVHGNKYDYSKSHFISLIDKIEIVCPKHGSFLQTPYNHIIEKHNCQKCSGRNLSTKEIISKFKETHGDKYDYSKVVYQKTKSKVEIFCPVHGSFFQTPQKHIKGQGCPECAKKNLTQKQFIEKAIEIHGNKYDYSKTVYQEYQKKIIITCPIHGDFNQLSVNHLQGCGCPKCNQSHMEETMMNLLERNGIKYIYQFHYSAKNTHSTLDFYLPEYNCAIECQGGQHFTPVDFGGKGIEWAKNEFEIRIKRDIQKSIECNVLGIKLYYYINQRFIACINNQIHGNIYMTNNVFSDINMLLNKIKNPQN